MLSCSSDSSEAGTHLQAEQSVMAGVKLLSPECSPKRINMAPKDISLGFRALETTLPSFLDAGLRKERRKARASKENESIIIIPALPEA